MVALNPSRTVWLTRWVLVLLLLGVFAGCERPPVEPVQRGYRGTGMVQVYNPRTIEADAPRHAMPEIAAPARLRPGAPKAGAVYQNLQVLGDLSIAEFGRTMEAITSWIAPEQSCAYCHVEGNFADDGKYTKVVARRMLQMVRHVNSDLKAHVAETGVTCYTCHRGQPLPAYTWFKPTAAADLNMLGARNGQNAPGLAVGLASLPSPVFVDYLESEATARPIRVAGTTPLSNANRASIQQAEFTYALMTHMSQSLGVNCTFCHNSRAFASWDESSPQRAVAWQGIRMVRDLNSNYLSPLSGTFPEVPLGRLGPSKDAAKLHCATCHQGAYKPLNGAPMARHYPALYAGEPPAPSQAPRPTTLP